MDKKTKKETFVVEDEIVVEFSTTARVSLNNLGIFPEGMSESEIKAILIKTFHRMLGEQDSVEFFSYKVKLFKESSTTRSIPIMADEKIE